MANPQTNQYAERLAQFGTLLRAERYKEARGLADELRESGLAITTIRAKAWNYFELIQRNESKTEIFTAHFQGAPYRLEHWLNIHDD